MKMNRREALKLAAFTFTTAALPAAQAQTKPAAGAKPAAGGAATTLSFNWEAAYGRANILVWPFRPGGRFEMLVNQHTGGTVKLDIKEKLFGIMDSAFAIGDGRVQSGTQSVPASSGTYPLLDFGGIPGLFSDMPQGAVEYAEAFLDPEMMKLFDQYTQKAGFKIIGAAQSFSNSSLWGNKPIRTLADFKGVKMRASGRTQTSALKALGGSPLTLSMAEIEEALSRGTVDAITSSKSFGAERGLMALCKYVSFWPVTPIFPQFIAVNNGAWGKLSQQQKDGLMRAAAQLSREMPFALEQIDITYSLWIRSSKTEMVNPEASEVKKAMDLMAPVIKEWIDTSGPLARDVLRVAAKYAKGPAIGAVQAALK